MSERRFMHSVMCDDIRQEIGGKISYMGIYGANILLPQFPFMLPKLCFVMNVSFPPGEDPPNSIKFRLYRDEELLAEQFLRNDVDLTAVQDRSSKRAVISAIFQMFPLMIPGPGMFKARAACEDEEEELKGGAWVIEQAAQAQPPPP